MKRNQLPIIRLAPWEHMPNALPQEIESPSQNVESFEWCGQRFELAARFAEVGDGSRYLFLRDVSGEGEGNWVLGRGWHDDMPYPFFGNERLGLRGRLASVSNSHYFPFGRLFHFSREELGTDKSWRAFVVSSGSGCWIEPLLIGERWGRKAEAFRLPVGPRESLLDWSASDLRAVMLQHIGCPDSDVRFALDWAQHTQLEQEELALCVRRGVVADVRQLLLCALKIDPELQKHQAEWDWEVEQEERKWSGLNLHIPNQMPQWAPISLQLRAWKRAILAYFRPNFNADLRRRHVCVRKSTTYQPYLLRIRTQSPTQHERLEAALWLREWAQGKVPPRKLQLLLSRV